MAVTTKCSAPRCESTGDAVAVAARWVRLTFRAVDYPACSSDCATVVLRRLHGHGLAPAAEQQQLPYGAAS